MSDTLHPCGYCGEMTSNGCDVVAVVACDRHFGADPRAFAEMHEQLAAERARAEAAEGREARLREAGDLLANTVGLLNSMVLCGEDHSETSRKVMRESLDAFRAALAGTPKGERE